MEKIQIDYSHNGEIACIILNDGKGNILDSNMMRDLRTAFTSFKTQPNLKLITFEGAGKHFSFGASVEEHTRENCMAMLSSFHQIFYDLINLSVPTLAKVSGQCLGGGMELALMCNFIFADKTAMMGQPEIMLGVYAPAASVLLPLKIGSARSDELLLTGNSIDATKAKEFGIVNEIFEDKAAMDEALGEWIAKNICRKSAVSLKHAVKAARSSFNETVLRKLPELEYIYVKELMDTSDANEGITSFLEKRKPVWSNS